MFRRSWSGFLLSLVFILFAYSSAVADTPVFNSKDGKWYGAINAGITILNDMDVAASASGGGYTLDAAATLSYEDATSFGGAIGYVISDFVRTELELGYQEMHNDKIDASLTATFTNGDTFAVSGSAKVIGQIDALHVLQNVIFTPLGNKTLFEMSVTPLVGAGIGFIDWESEISQVGTLAVTGVTASDTDFLASVMTGLEYTTSQQLTLAIKYRHVWADTGKNGVEDAEADNIVANLKIAF